MVKYKIKKTLIYFKSLAGAYKVFTIFFKCDNGKSIKLKVTLDKGRNTRIVKEMPVEIELQRELTERTTGKSWNKDYLIKYKVFYFNS